MVANLSSNVMRGGRLLGTFNKKFQAGIDKEIRRVAANILRTAKVLVPVRTGALRRSGRIERLSVGGKAITDLLVAFGGPGTGVDYAPMVEFGTYQMAGHFYLLRAVRKHQHELIKFNAQSMEQIWDEDVLDFNTTRLT